MENTVVTNENEQKIQNIRKSIFIKHPFNLNVVYESNHAHFLLFSVTIQRVYLMTGVYVWS